MGHLIVNLLVTINGAVSALFKDIALFLGQAGADVLAASSIAVSALAGLGAVLTDFKDKNARKSLVGVSTIVGLVLSIVLNVSNALVDANRRTLESTKIENETLNIAKETRNTEQQTLKLANEIHRSLNLISNVVGAYFVSYPADSPELVSYRDQLYAKLQALLPDIQSPSTFKDFGVSVAQETRDGQVKKISLEMNSPFLPDRDKETPAAALLETTSLIVEFFKPLDNSQVSVIDLLSGKPDMRMTFDPMSDQYSVSKLQFDLSTRKLSVYVSNIGTDPQYWKSTNRIISTIDLPGCYMLVVAYHLVPGTGRTGAAVLRTFNDATDKSWPNVESLFLHVADRNQWWFPMDKFVPVRLKSGQKGVFYHFPNSFDDMIRVLERHY
jgi:hypothetical protein